MSVSELSRSEGIELSQDGLLYTYNDVDCMINQKRTHSKGTLYYTQNNLIFVSSDAEDYSLVIEYQSIGVHAVSQESTLWNRPCIYCQICDACDCEGGCDIMYGDPTLENFVEEEEEDNEPAEENEESDDSSIFEILFSPMSSDKIDTMFNNLSRLQVMHPDPVKEEDEDDGMFMTANGLISVEDHVCNLFEQAAAEYESSQNQ